MRTVSTGHLKLAMAVCFVGAASACGGGVPSFVTVAVDTASESRPINPLIYGVSASGGGTQELADMGVAVVRWGGNSRSRHNWEINASNAGADWEFRNVSQGDMTPGSAALEFFAANRAIGAESILTIPMVGWVARDRDSDTRSLDVPVVESVNSINDYDPAVNRQRSSVVSLASKNGALEFPPDLGDGAVYQDEWVAHLVRQLGTAGEGGIRFYEMGNEPTLWWDTHTDVAPTPVSYSDYLDTFLAYATAVKRVDQTAQVLGPSVWGWTAYFSTAPNGDEDQASLPFIPRMLTDLNARDIASGTRTLDTLSVHYYPQGGVFSDNADPEIRELRIRSTRSLWDPGYRDESWIADTPQGPTVRLIPRLREWIDQHYPETGLAITEWNWGAEHDISGGLAAAEVLGIFGREGVDIATYWGRPTLGSPVYWAFRMFRNYDGVGGAFGDRSLPSTSSHPDNVSTFASLASDGRLHLMLINKDSERAIDVRVELSGTATDASVEGWLYSADTGSIVQVPATGLAQGVLSYTLPPYSITLLIADSEAN